MNMIQPILMELEQEAATTRRVLSCVPTDQLGWRPHPKARSLGELATHIAVSQKRVASAVQGATYQLDSDDTHESTRRVCGRKLSALSCKL